MTNDTTKNFHISMNQGVDLRDYLRIAQKRKRYILFFFLITVIFTIIGTFLSTPKFKATTQLLIKQNQPTNLIQNLGLGRNDPRFLQTQYEIIKSRSVINRVIEQLQLHETYKAHFLGESDSFLSRIVKKLTDLLKSPKGNLSELHNDALSPPEDVENKDTRKINEIIADNIRIQPVKDSHIINISYIDGNPILAKRIVNSIARGYKDELLEIKMQSSNYSLAWMTRKAGEEKKKLQKRENQLQEYRRKHDIITVENKVAILPEKLRDFGTQFSEAQTHRQELEEINAQIEKAKKNTAAIESLPWFAENNVLQNLRMKLLEADQNSGELAKKYGPKHPRMIKVQNERQVIIKEKENEVNRIIESTRVNLALAQSKEDNLNQLLSETKNEALQFNENYVQYDILNREVVTDRILYESLITKIKEQSATSQEQDVKVLIVQEALTPERKDSPKTAYNLILSVTIGLMGGIILAFLTEYLDDTIKTPDEIEKRLQVPVLGVIENISGKKQNINTLVLDEPFSTFAENYKGIRSSVLLSAPNQPPKTILISSQMPEDGKSTVAINVARTLSMMDSRVLLIDCDLRNPYLHISFGLNNSKGLSSTLTGTSEGNIILPSSQKGLNIMPTGPVPPNPGELLGSRAMNQLLQSLATEYDFILLDSAPLLSVADSDNLAAMTDGTILVAVAEQTTYDKLSTSIKRLQAIHGNLLGVVINRAKITRFSGYTYPGYLSGYGQKMSDQA